MISVWRALCTIAALGAMGACSHLPSLSESGPAPSAAATPRELVRAAIDLLGQGQERQARSQLRAALAAHPGNRSALRLMQQLDADPRTLLTGPEQQYIVRPGETMSEIAARFQGDALLFYALARLNGIEAPNQIVAGQRLLVPRRPGLTVRETALSSEAPTEAPAAEAPAAPQTSTAARANQMRLQGLERLNAGDVNRAVALLRQARALDSGNTAIQRDLDRAERLQASLRSRG